MTREEAIKYFRNAKGLSSTFDKVADIAIEALSAKSIDVVRCKDCLYKQYDATHNFCEINYHKCYDDDFCSWGERKGGDVK